MIEGVHIFKPVKQTRVTEDIFEQILSRVADGTLKPGHRLPNERELSLVFGVSRSTMREALRMLEHSGVVRIKYGSQGGAFVAADSHSLVSNALRLMVRLTQTPLLDLLESRRFIEAATARLAAERAEDEHLLTMRKSLEDTERHIDDPSILAQANEEFHIAIAQAAHNPILFVTMQSIQSLVVKSVHDLIRSPKAGRYLLMAHSEIYEAIVKRDPESAQSAMIRHIGSIEKRALRHLQGDSRCL